MSELQATIELTLLVAAGLATTALLLGKVVIMAYQDFRNTWRKLKLSDDKPVPSREHQTK